MAAQHAVGVGYAPVHVRMAPSTGGKDGIDGGSRRFVQKDAQNHEEYHYQAGSQGFTDKDRGHQRAGWRERGYRIVAEKEYVDRDKHHDKGYGVDNQERGHRLKSQGQHGHKQGHDDIRKAEEHYSHGLHDSAHHEKIPKNANSPYGKAYHVEGASLYPAGPRDHLSSSTDKVADLEAGNSTNPEDNSDASRRKKVIRIRVLSKAPDLTSVTISGQVMNAASEIGNNNARTADSPVEPPDYFDPPKGIPQGGDTARSAEIVSSDPSSSSEQPPKKQFVPIEVLRGLYEKVRGETAQNQNVNHQQNAPNIYGQATYGSRAVSGRQIYNENSFEPVVIDPVLQAGEKQRATVDYGTPAYRPAPNSEIAGTVPYAPSIANGGQPYPRHHEYSRLPPSGFMREDAARNRENYGAEPNVDTEGHRSEPVSGLAIPSGAPYTAISGNQIPRDIRFRKSEKGGRQKLPNDYGDPGTFDSNQESQAVRVPSQHHRFHAAGQRQYSDNGAAPLVHQQPAGQVIRSQTPGYPHQGAQHPYTYPYVVDTAVVVPSQEVRTAPAVHAAAYPVYIEGTAVLPESYTAPEIREAVHVSFSPQEEGGANGYHGVNNPATGSYVRDLPRIQEASEIVPVGQEKNNEQKGIAEAFDDENDSALAAASENGEYAHDNGLNDTDATKAEEPDLDSSFQLCHGENCTLPIERSRLNQAALAKAKAIFRHFEQIKIPHRKCRTEACQLRKPPCQDRKCGRKKAATSLSSSKKRSFTSPANRYDGRPKENANSELISHDSDDQLRTEMRGESGGHLEGQRENQAKPSTMEEQATMAADAELRNAKPVLEGIGYISDADTAARKPLFLNKMVKIVKKDYFSQPLLLNSGGKVKEDGFWHAKKSAS